jgi:GNAT superfamily N-acetyltransferase
MPAHFTDARTHARTATVVVRDAGPADRADLREMVHAAYAPFATALPLTAHAALLADALDFDKHARRGQPIVAEIDGRIRGSAVFYPNTFNQGMAWPRGWAGGEAMTVHPAARRHGVARALLAECERRARVSGAQVFAFHTAMFMTEAIALYDGLGYCRAAHFDLDVTSLYNHPTASPIKAIAYSRNLRDAGPCPSGAPSDHRRPTVARPSWRPGRPHTA